MRKHLKELQEYFPHLEEQDMKRRKPGDKFPGMCMLWVLLFHDRHKEVFRWVVTQLREKTSMPQNAFWVLEFLRFFVKRRRKQRFKITPEKALAWCKENVYMTDAEDEEDEEDEEESE